MKSAHILSKTFFTLPGVVKSMILLSILLASCGQPIEQDQNTDRIVEYSKAGFSREGLHVQMKNGELLIEDSFLDEKTSGVVLPIERVVLTSTTQLVYFQALAQLDKIVGCPWLDFVKDQDVIERRSSGELVDVTKGAGLDLEKVISLEPDLILYDPREMDMVSRLKKSGIACIPFVEYLARDPLDRVAWIELIGLLCDDSKQAILIEDSIAYMYDSLMSMPLVEAPTVLFGSYYQGVWSAAGGGSLIAQLIKDAGAEYALQGEEIASVDLDPEKFIRLLADVDYLGMIQQGELTRKDWIGLDPRLDEQMIEGKGIFYCNTLESDYFGKGILEPQVILRDIHDILSGAESQGAYFKLAE